MTEKLLTAMLNPNATTIHYGFNTVDKAKFFLFFVFLKKGSLSLITESKKKKMSFFCVCVNGSS